MPRHELTDEERKNGGAKGGRARAANARRRNEEAKARAAEQLDKALDRAVEVFVEAMYAGGEDADHPTRVKAAAQVADRVLGRATQRTEVSGSVDHHIEYRERLSARLADQAERIRTNGHSQ